VLELLAAMFGGDAPHEPLQFHQVCARAVVVYLGGLAIVRLGKSRLISHTTALDVILGFLLGSLLSRGITGNASISGTLGASAAVVLTHWMLTRLGLRSHRLGLLLKGRDAVLVDQGRMQPEAMRRSHISEDDLLESIRLHGLAGLGEVESARKERNGEISVRERRRPS
jgi:uncharacterized membrane protein YcaP (DUF421 family)